MSKDIICTIDGISKRFPGVLALDKVSFEIKVGEVHAVVGENGAGKSTLMNILSGVFAQDDGTIFFDGKPVHFSQPKEANKAGIAMIHQELSLAQHMSAFENIFEGRMLKRKSGFIDRRKMIQESERLFEKLGVSYINPRSLAKNLSVSEQQLLEIAKAISLNARMLIMDEPTSSLTAGEIEFLFNIVSKLKCQGVSILYISHKLEEIMRIADSITVLRDGKHISTKAKEEMNEQAMINLMVGRIFDRSTKRTYMSDYDKRIPLLEVKNLCDVSGRIKDVSFKLYKGEVLGLTGLVGSGRSELLQSIFGAQAIKSGKILFEGKEVKITNCRDAIRLGMALIPEGRKVQGLFLKMNIEANMTIVRLGKLKNKIGLLDKKKIKHIAAEYVERLSVKTPSLLQKVSNLSGGNQQKTIVARWLMNDPKILFMDEPTHGIDIGAKFEIYKIIDDLSKLGVSIILLSSEMPEVLTLCDRIMVMHHGKLCGELEHDEADQVKIMSYSLELNS